MRAIIHTVYQKAVKTGIAISKFLDARLRQIDSMLLKVIRNCLFETQKFLIIRLKVKEVPYGGFKTESTTLRTKQEQNVWPWHVCLKMVP